MANVVYISNYMQGDVVKIRKAQKTYSQACNNKVSAIKKLLEAGKNKVTILSNGLVNNKSFRLFRRYTSSEEDNVIYGALLDIPVFNILSTILSIFHIIKKMNRSKKIDYIIFYNYKPETAVTALLAKMFLKIRIIVDYEDGYFLLNSINPLKRMLINLTEKLVSPWIDGALLVTSGLIPRIGDKKYCIIRGVTNGDILEKAKLIQKTDNRVPIVMYSGGLDEERGIKLLLQSLKYTDKEFELHISGNGPLSDYVRGYEDKRIRFLDYLDYEQLKEKLVKADILVIPQISRNDFGKVSFPSKMFDYIATGNLIITSNVSDMESFFYHELIYWEDDPKALSIKLEEALQNYKNQDIRNKIRGLASENTVEALACRLADFLTEI